MGAVKEMFMEMREKELAPSLGLNSLMQADKRTIEDKVRVAVDNINDGHLDPLEVLIYAKKGKELFDLLEKNVRPIASGKSVQKGYAAYDCKVIEKNEADKYDFTVCGDSTWDILKAKESAIKEDLKKREAFLKTITEPIVIEGTGELINPPSITRGTITLALTLK